MSLTIAVQMDPIETINPEADSTFVLGLESQRRGHRLWHYLPRDLAYWDGRLFAVARPLELRQNGADYASLGEPTRLDLGTVDVILMRQDPPFNMAYITATHLLEQLTDRVLVVNDPASVRNAPEKLFVTQFPDLMPPTLITSNKAEIIAFREEHRDIIVKPIYGNGGAGVFHLKPDDDNLGSLLEVLWQIFPEPLIVQRYLPEILEGDKRIILVEGEPVGAVTRLPQSGEARANFHAGGTAARTSLTEREHQICAAIGPELRRRGLVFVGIDVIGDFLTEINVTSPTGLQEISRLDGTRLESLVVDAIEARRSAQASAGAP